MIKNPDLRQPIGEKEDSTLPGMYKNSKLFPRKKPHMDKSSVYPDEDFEELERDDDMFGFNLKKREVKKSSVVNNSLAVHSLKKAVANKPDITGKFEGRFKVSLEEMIQKLNELISIEYSQWLRYYHYALVLRGHNRDALSEEFEGHAEEELEHAERLIMRVVALGGYPSTLIEPALPLRETEEIIQELLYREQEGMQHYREALEMCGDNAGTAQIFESIIDQEQEHIDDLWRYLNQPSLIKAMSAGKHTMPFNCQAARENDNSFQRYSRNISGSASPDLPDRGRDWHGTATPDDPTDDAPLTDEEKREIESGKCSSERPFLTEQKSISKKVKKSLKTLASVPQFFNQFTLSPKEQEFLLSKGYDSEQVRLGKIYMTPRMRSDFNMYISTQLQKSLLR